MAKIQTEYTLKQEKRRSSGKRVKSSPWRDAWKRLSRNKLSLIHISTDIAQRGRLHHPNRCAK